MKAGTQVAEGFLCSRRLSNVSLCTVLVSLRAEIAEPRRSLALSKSGKTDEEQ